jgi:hypothetical protein
MEYQFAMLTMIFEVKQDGQHKARLTHGQTKGYQLPINGSDRHQRPIAGFNCAL